MAKKKSADASKETLPDCVVLRGVNTGTQNQKNTVTPPKENLTGNAYDHWTVIRFAGRDAHSMTYWECRCDCGTIRNVKQRNLLSGLSTSCGCSMAEKTRKRATVHGKYNTPEYIAWQSMKSRCYDTKGRSYKDYGGRGITVCPRWLDSFQNFYADMGDRPTPKHSLDRKENSKGYCPENCHWATRKEQNNNARFNRRLTHHGETLTITEWSLRTGINLATLRHRLRKGWSVPDALGRPLRRQSTKAS